MKSWVTDGDVEQDTRKSQAGKGDELISVFVEPEMPARPLSGNNKGAVPRRNLELKRDVLAKVDL